MSTKFVKFFAAFIALLFSLMFSALILFQTDFAKDKIRDLVSKQTLLSFDKMEGILPFELILTNAKIELNDKTISINKLKARPALFSLLRKQIHLHSLQAEGVSIEDKGIQKKVLSTNTPTLFSLPFSLKISKYQITDLQYENLLLNLKGKFKLNRDLSSYHVSTTLTRKGFKGTRVDLNIRKKRMLNPSLSFHADIRSLKAFAPYLELSSPDIQKGYLSISGKGEKQFLQDILNSKMPKIEAQGKGSIQKMTGNLELPIYYAFNLTTPYLNFDDFKIYSEEFFFLSSFSLQKNLSIKKSAFSLKLKAFDGSFKTNGSFSYQNFVQADFFTKSNQFSIDKYTLTNLKLAGSLTYKDYLEAKISGSVDSLENRFHIHTDLTSLNDALNFSNIRIQSPYITTKGNITLANASSSNDAPLQTPSLSTMQLLGRLDGSFSSLTFIKKYLSDFSDIGKGKFTAHFDQNQKIHLDLNLNNFFYHHFSINSLTSSLDLLDYSFDKLDNISIRLQNAQFQNLQIHSASLNTSTLEENWPFDLSINGNLSDPIQINSKGYWRYNEDELNINIQDLTGSLINHPFISEQPIQLEWAKDKLLLTELKIDLIDSSLFASANMKEESGSITTKIKNFPIDFLLLFSPYYDLKGSFSLDANLTNQQENLLGNVEATFHDLALPSMPPELKTNGKFQAEYKNNLLDASTLFTIGQKPYLNAKVTLPLMINPLKLSAQIEKESPLKGILSFSGSIEDIMDLFDLGPHTISGDLKANFKASGSFAYPVIVGNGKFTKGFYENAFTGTTLTDITATIKANSDTLALESLSAKGPKGGTLTSTGSIDLDEGNFPFTFNVNFEKLRGVEIGFFDAEGRANLTVEGDKNGAIAKGRIKVKDANFTIAEKLPTSIPNLDINYIHAPPSFSADKTSLTTISSFPFLLDITIDAPENISITGRGVESEWKGSFHIGGDIHRPIPAGSIELLNGEFRFSGRDFTLTEGRLTFPEKLEAVPSLYLTGKMTQKNTTIIANLNGPLTRPKLTFSSVPPLSNSSILSLLLFGQDISEISGPQAIQLAALASSLSGDGPDILESTRKSLGVDRLSLVSIPTKEELDSLSIQVGKYITKGIMVTLSQGAGADQSNVGVEVDLSNGFVFQAETQQQLEQGRFTLKWNVTY